MGRLVNMAVFLIISLCILTPIIGGIRDGDAFWEDMLPEANETYMEQENEYLENLKNITQEKLKSAEIKIINRDFKLSEGEISIDFIGEIRNGQYHLCCAELKIYTVSALSKRDYITHYLEEKYECEIRVREEII